jgi:hypothetical protein
VLEGSLPGGEAEMYQAVVQGETGGSLNEGGYGYEAGGGGPPLGSLG